MLTTTIDHAEKYNYLGERFRKAFAFLRDTDFSVLSEGKVEIDGENIFAEVQEYVTNRKTNADLNLIRNILIFSIWQRRRILRIYSSRRAEKGYRI
mgnify:CR=1 FL=1